ncbi:conserved repeat domain-containing protein/gliding motility-associated C-terminal domain-containing protein [Chitinophaga jiangningensis]|uniref:Conserved repeat domain-containing protein/gliding motility-associated C-terminal domain-containing protein n=1 Tax=Chitinophaga jiangningensis TaxID=1419482 RepID=A0A1M7H721_9BACT|nr:gliding motility-associated C-terminal domain-containing protein [Chitinophaga jiangningensis]SHM24163.1 conserved repeat domain-containing protein/gliding motility-associated C-terminal domain-containing protein [Chitinophaga jiangningensis]
MGKFVLRYTILLFCTILLASGQATMAQNPDMTITKTNSGNLRKSLTGTYTLTVRNLGTSKVGGNLVTVTDVLPAGLIPGTPTGNGWTITTTGNTITATRSDVLGGGGDNYPDITIPVKVASDAPNTITNTATVTTPNDNNAANNSATDIIDTRRHMDMEVTFIETPPNACVNNAYTIQVGIRNNGPDSAVNAKLQVGVTTAVNNISLVRKNITAGGGFFGTGSVVNSVYIDSITLTPNGMATFVFNVLVTQPAPANLGIVEVAVIRSGTDLDTDASNPNNQVPGNEQEECNAAPSGGGCNNIKRDTTLVANAVTADAGPDQNNCENSGANLQGNNVTGVWTQAYGPTTATINNPTFPNTNVNNLQYGTYAFVWTVSNGGCGNASDTVLITNWQQPTPSRPGGDATICGTSYTLQAERPTAGTGVWSQSSGPNNATFDDPANPNATVSGLIEGTYVFVWTTSNGPVCPPNSQQVTIRVNAGTTTANAGPDQQLCNTTSTTMQANTPGQNENGNWQQIAGPSQANILNNGSPTTDIQNLQTGTYSFVWRIQGGSCPSTQDTVNITVVTGGNTANAGPDQTKYNSGIFVMNANSPATGTGTWAVIAGSANISNTTDPNTTVTLQPNSSATLTWTINNGACGSSVDTVVLQYLQQADVRITKTLVSGNYQTGTTVTYRLLIENLGPAAATGVTITDAVPAQLTNVSWNSATTGTNVLITPTSGTGNNISAVANIPFATGNQIVVTVRGTVDSSANGGTVITNTATASAATGIPDPDLSNNTSTVTGTVPNNPPVAVDDYYATVRDVPVSGNVVTNDYDLENDPLTVTTTPVQQPAHGTVQLNADGTFTYTPAPGYQGTDMFVYRVCDSHGACDNANVYISILPPVLNMTVDKSASVPTVAAGGALTYTAVVTNNGPSTIYPNETFTVRDTLPTGFILQSTSISQGTFDQASGNVTGVTLAPGQSVTITATGSVAPTYQQPSITNRITVYPPVGSVYNNEPKDSVTTPVTKAVEVVVTKTDNKLTYTPGVPNTYLITVTNNGPSDLIGATIADPFPPGITLGLWTITSNSNSLVNSSGFGAINQQVDIPAGTTLTIKYTLSIPSGYTGQLVNTATVTIPDGYTNINPGGNTATDIDNQESRVDITTQKSGPASVAAGEPMSYTLVISNDGPSDLLNAAVQDLLPVKLSSPSWTVTPSGAATATPASGTGNVNFTANIPAGTDNTLTVLISGTVAADATGTLTNLATVTPPGGIADSSNQVNTVITSKTGINILKTGPASGHVVAGDPISYTVTVTNSGPSNATNVLLRDTVPAAITNVSWRITGSGGAAVATGAPASGTGNIIGSAVNIPAGSGNQIILTVDGTVNPNATGLLSNTAYATADGTTKNANNITMVENEPALSIVKAGPASADAGSIITYTLKVTNSGPSNAVNALIADDLPSSLTNVSWTATAVGAAVVKSGATGSGNTLNVTADIPAGANNIVTITITATIKPAVVGVITNQGSATVNGDQTTSSRIETIVNSNSQLQVVKSGPATVAAGGTLTYNLTVLNPGPSDASLITLKDTFPAMLSNAVVKTSTDGSAAVTNVIITGNVLEVTGNIKAGDGNAIHVTVNLLVDPAFSGTITNQAGATTGNGNRYPSNVVTTEVLSQPKLQVVKSGPDTVSAGLSVNYLLRLTNNGLSDAQQVVISDVVPAALTDVYWTTGTAGTATITSGATGTGNNVNITANIPHGAGNLIDVFIFGKSAAGYQGTIQNVATATPGGGTAVPSDTVTTAIVSRPQLLIQKSGPQRVVAGGKVVYTIDVTNQGPSDAQNVDISDLVPPEMINVTWRTFVSGGASIITNTTGVGNNVATYANIPASTGYVRIIVDAMADPSAAGTVLNVAAETIDHVDSLKSTVQTLILNDPALVLQKTGPDTISAGRVINYTLIATNLSTANANNILLQDVVPPEITNVTWTASVTGDAVIASGQTGSGNNVVITGNIPGNTGNHIFVNVAGTVRPDFTGTFRNFGAIATPGNAINYSDTVVTTVTNTPNIKIVKTAPDSVAAGGTINFSLLVTNSGPSDATNLNITDALPATLSNVTWTSVSSGNASVVTGGGSGNNVLVTGNIAAGANNYIRINITATVDPAFTGTIANSAVVNITGKPPVVSNETQTIVYTKPGLSVTKIGQTKANIGDEINYTILVRNAGPSNATGITITDIVPADIINVTWVGRVVGNAQITSASSGAGNNINLTGNIAAVGLNAIYVTVRGTVKPDATTSALQNIASVSAPGQSVITDTANTSLVYSPGLQLKKTGPASLHPGDAVTYTINVTNAGPSDITTMSIGDAINTAILNPVWTATTTGNATVDATSGTGNINLTGSIAAGAGNRISITISGQLDPAYQQSALINTAVGTIPGTLPVASTVNTTVTSSADMTLTKSGPSQAAAGENITYTLTLTNAGPSNVYGYTFNDVIPSGLTNATWTATPTGTGATVSATSGTGNVSFTGDLPADAASIQVVIHATVKPDVQAGNIINTASAIATGVPQAAATFVTAVAPHADLAITKSGPATIREGQQVAYTLKVTNNGPSDVLGATISDAVPAGITITGATATTTGNASATSPSIVGQNGSLVVNIGAGAGNAVIVTINGVVTPGVAASITNTAIVTPPAGLTDDNLTNNTSTVTSVTNTVPGGGISKSGPASAHVGDTIQYVMTIDNNGLTDLNGIAFTDNVPAGLQVIGWNAVPVGNASITPSSGTGNNIAATVNVGSSLSGAITITVDAIVLSTAGATVINTATLNTAPPQSSTVVTNIDQSVNLKINKTGPLALQAGLPITYTITVSNAGAADVVNALIEDTISYAILNPTWTATGQDGATVGTASGSGNISLNASIPANQGSVFITVRGTVDPGFQGVITNTAVATLPPGVSGPSPVTSVVNTVVSANTALQILKSGPDAASSGGHVSYVVQVSNPGPATANGIAILDTIAASLTNVSWQARAINGTITSGAAGTGNLLNVQANLSDGGIARIFIDGTIRTDFTGTILNTAHSTQGGNDYASNQVRTVVTTQAGIAITKTGPAKAQAGAPVDYVITVTNRGPADAIGVTIGDLIPPQILNPVWTAIAEDSAQITSGNTTNIPGNVVLTANIRANATSRVVVTVRGTIDPTFSGTITNVGQAQLPNQARLTDTVVTTVTNFAGLDLHKTGPDSAAAGSLITYSVTVVNNGPSAGTGIRVVDTLATALQDVKWSATANGLSTIQGGNVINKTGNPDFTANMPAGAANSILLTITGRVAPSFTGTISNHAVGVVNGVNVPSNTINTVVSSIPGVHIVKAGPPEAKAGGRTSYSIVVTNAGPSDAPAIQISDIIPAAIQGASWQAAVQGSATINGGSSLSGTGNISFTGSIPAGSNNAILISIIGTIDPTFSGALTNTAKVQTGSVMDSSMVTTNVISAPKVTIQKSGPDTVSAGAGITYSLIVQNTGLVPLNNLSITDLVPVEIQNVSWSAVATGGTITGGSSGSGNNVTVTGTLAVGTQNNITVTITGTVNAADTASISNVCHVAEGNTILDRDHVVTAVMNSANVQLTKSGPARAASGSRITYLIDATNYGPSDVLNATISDVVVNNLQNVTWTVTTSGNAVLTSPASGTGNNINVTGTLPAGDSNHVHVVVQGTIDPNFTGTLVNTATGRDSKGRTKQSTVTTLVTKQAIPGIAKSGPATANAGDAVSYQLSVSNLGTSNIDGAVITDTVPALLTNVTWSASGVGTAFITGPSSGSGNNISLKGSIPAGAANSIQIRVTGRIPANATATSMSNTAAVTAADGTTARSNTVVTTINKRFALKVVKTGPATANAGDSIKYVLRVTNSGPSDGAAVTIGDVLSSNNFSGYNWAAAAVGKATLNSIAIGTNTPVNVLANLPAGDTNAIVLTITAQVRADFSGQISNTGTAAVSGTIVNSNTVVTTVTRVADVSILKYGDLELEEGAFITYTLVARNNGPASANGAVITDAIPARISGITSNVTLAENGAGNVNIDLTNNLLKATVGTFPAGSSVIIVIKGQLTGVGVVTNQAFIEVPAGVTDPVPQNNSSRVVNSVVTQQIKTDLQLTKTYQGAASLHVGDRVSFNIAVTNAGPRPDGLVTVRDTLQPNLELAGQPTVSTGSVTYDAASRILIWSIGAMQVNDAHTMALTARVTNTGSVRNAAAVGGLLPDLDLANNYDTTAAIPVTGDDIFLPNIISPNGDGKNDYFKIPGIERYPNSTLIIYNRWGNQVYQSKNYHNEWDGHNLNEGTYFYILQLNTGNGEREYKGWIELVR